MPYPQNEKDLITGLKNDDAVAFDLLFQLYGQKLYGFALKYLKSESEAEEMVQEVFVRLWENRRLLKSDYSFKSYLFTIALNQIRKFFNKRAATLRFVEQLQTETLSDNHTVDSIDYGSVLKRIDEIVDTFPERKKQIFLKSRKEGKSSKEIAAELDISAGTVDNQVSDALRIIRKGLKGESIVSLLFATLFLS
ncbi:MAG: RNA polymerase sigma-70 factor [Prolixibacteraceae bacterium]